jgi:fructokinase
MAITCGSFGCQWLTRELHGEVEGFAVSAVDTTGAGDAFMAGVIAGLLADPETPEDAARIGAICRFANAAGALATTGRGAIPSLPTRDEVHRLLRRTSQ